MIHGKQAVKGIRAYFDHWIASISHIVESDSVIRLDEKGKYLMEILLKSHEPGAKAITRSDKNGRIVHTIPFDSNLIGGDISGQEHIKELARTRKPVLSSVFTTLQGYRAIALTVPVFEGTEFQGGLGVLLDFEYISKQFLGDIVIGKSGYAWVIDKDGTELYCPVPGHTGNSVFDNCKDFPSILSMAREMLKAREGEAVYFFNRIRGDDPKPVKKHAVYLPVRIANTFWSIVVSTSEDEVLASLVHFRNQLIGVVAVLLLGSLLFSYYAMRSWGIVKEEKKRRSAEIALRESRARFQTLFISMNEGMVLHQLVLDEKDIPIDYVILEANEAFERITGIRRETAIGRKASELYGTGDAPYLDIYAKVALTMEPITFETTFDPLGKSLLISCFSPEKGQFATVFEDITERKIAEIELRRSEERYRELYDEAPVGYMELDGEGRITRVNQRELEILGWSAEEALGRHIWDFVEEEESRDIIRAKLAGLYPPSKGLERFYRRKDGSRVCVLIDDRLVKADDGRIVGIRSTIQDITERKRSEEKLASSEEKFKAAFEGSHDAITITTAEGRFLECNRKALEMFRLDSKQSFGASRPADFSPEYQPDGRRSEDAADDYRKKAIKERVSHFEWLHHRSTGEIFPTEITLTSYLLRGKMVLQATIRDIGDRKKTEEERERLQAQLIQAQKMESVGRLAGGVAHDFNNMLGIIIGNAEMAVLQLDRSHPVHQCLEEILKAGNRSADTVRQLLAFARKQIISPKILDLNDAVSEMLKMLRRLIGEDIDLAWLPGYALRPVKIDPSQVDQILANLAVNARDAIAGVGKLTIETSNVTIDEPYCARHKGFLPGDYVLLAVSDNGTGMDKEVLEHLFEPFFTTKGVGKGTGLGLSTIYGIVKQNGGLINVYSEVGHGTTFKIYLPSLKTEPLEEGPAEEPQQLPGGTETVLMVEDEDAILRVGKAMLEELGYRVLTSSTPGTAIRMAKENGENIHLLLTDVVMPEMNGRDLADRIKTLFPGLKCLFMSGYTADVIAHHGVLDEGVIFLQKPFSLGDLARRIRETLDRKDEENL